MATFQARKITAYQVNDATEQSPPKSEYSSPRGQLDLSHLTATWLVMPGLHDQAQVLCREILSQLSATLILHESTQANWNRTSVVGIQVAMESRTLTSMF